MKKRVYDIPRYSVSRAKLTREERLARNAATARQRRILGKAPALAKNV